MESCTAPASAYLETLPPTPLQPAFEPLVNAARNRLCAGLGPLLDSLYLYGSVARGHAQAGQSDLDLTLLLVRPLTPLEGEQLEQIRQQLEACHPEVSKVDFDVGVCADALSPANRDSWGYWLKHECRCIYGADRSLQFPPFRPSPAIAQALNGDYVLTLEGYAQRILQARAPAQIARWQKEAARKLVRATHVLRPPSDSAWPRTLEEYAAYFARHHPRMAAQIGFFLTQARTPDAPPALFAGELARFVAWMQQHHVPPPQNTTTRRG